MMYLIYWNPFRTFVDGRFYRDIDLLNLFNPNNSWKGSPLPDREELFSGIGFVQTIPIGSFSIGEIGEIVGVEAKSLSIESIVESGVRRDPTICLLIRTPRLYLFLSQVRSLAVLSKVQYIQSLTGLPLDLTHWQD